jgi:prepilin-type N-terminal cleavage/methylation domain-containing protein
MFKHPDIKRIAAHFKGFTLMELLISLSILGVGIIIIFSLFPLSLRSMTYGRKLTRVYFLAEKKMEEIKAIENKTTLDAIEGEEGDMHWSISPKDVQLGDGIDVIYVEVGIDYDFMGHNEKQKFGTYFFKECNC